MAITATEFQLFKATAVASGLCFAGVLQFISPYRRDIGGLLKNWRINVPLAALNLALTSGLCGGCACFVARWAEEVGVGLLNAFSAPIPVRAGISVLALDLTAYLWHRANHRLPFLWRFHSIHHSDQFFDASTAVRFHPGEILISLGIRVGAVLLLGIPVAGILAFEMAYAICNFFEHGNMRLNPSLERILALILVTPALHRKHHSVSRIELNSNFATILSLWDRTFRTYIPATSAERIDVGLPEGQCARPALFDLIVMPFRRR